MQNQGGEKQQAPVTPGHALLKVSVVTTSGSYPGKGERAVKGTDVVADLLREAGKALHLADTTDWIATVDGRDIDAAKTFAENGLQRDIVLHWGKREGGGG